ncbi:hypothetical protein [Lacihabitans sp. LS3-19]|nr:hypothetical protein [Lacihabitans sp. LS3-19]
MSFQRLNNEKKVFCHALGRINTKYNYLCGQTIVGPEINKE